MSKTQMLYRPGTDERSIKGLIIHKTKHNGLPLDAVIVDEDDHSLLSQGWFESLEDVAGSSAETKAPEADKEAQRLADEKAQIQNAAKQEAEQNAAKSIQEAQERAKAAEAKASEAIEQAEKAEARIAELEAKTKASKPAKPAAAKK